MSIIEKKDYRIVDCDDLVLLRFKNNKGGRDSIGFYGNATNVFEGETTETQTRDVADFSSTSIERGREKVVKKRSQDKVVVSRSFPIYNKEGVKQLIDSHYIELFTGVKNDTAANQRNKWLEVQINLLQWTERQRDNQLFVVIEIIKPERYIV